MATGSVPLKVLPAMRVITAGRLVLEPQVAAHAEEMFSVLSDPAIYEIENEPPSSPAWLRTRFTKLETRLSADGDEQWLNWVIRLADGGLIGYVQATIEPDGRAAVAYVLSSNYWGRGLARHAVEAMMVELAGHHSVRGFYAVLKQSNQRSLRLLERLGFTLALPGQTEDFQIESDEMLMRRN